MTPEILHLEFISFNGNYIFLDMKLYIIYQLSNLDILILECVLKVPVPSKWDWSRIFIVLGPGP
jgi:hypothetical protein